MKLVKVIRDKIGEDSDTVVYRRINDTDEFIEGLKKKLGEEVCEYLLNPSVEELADILQVVKSLAWNNHGFRMSLLEEMADKKRDAKGGFGHRRGLFIASGNDEDLIR